MQIVAYEPSLFSALAAAARGAAAGHSLGHRSFVDHYYTTVPWCRLYLALGDDGAVAGAIGVEQLRFEYEGRPLTIGCASNFVAFQPGAGGVLFLRWIRSSEMACIYGGSRDTHRILAHQGWTYFPGVHVYSLNGRYTDRPAEPRWRGVAKSFLRAVTPRVDVGERLRGAVARGVVPAVNVAEVGGFDADMLPRAGGFTFRLAPGTEYLGWRYSPALPFVRYRLFRLPRGYVVLNERPGRIVVAQADATDPDSLVGGVLAAVAQVAGEGSRPEVLLTSCHARMRRLYEQFGFRPAHVERPFALGSARGPVPLAPDTSSWLVNFDWTDNGLRPPFLDETVACPTAEPRRLITRRRRPEPASASPV